MTRLGSAMGVLMESVLFTDRFLQVENGSVRIRLEIIVILRRWVGKIYRNHGKIYRPGKYYSQRVFGDTLKISEISPV